MGYVDNGAQAGHFGQQGQPTADSLLCVIKRDEVDSRIPVQAFTDQRLLSLQFGQGSVNQALLLYLQELHGVPAEQRGGIVDMPHLGRLVEEIQQSGGESLGRFSLAIPKDAAIRSAILKPIPATSLASW